MSQQRPTRGAYAGVVARNRHHAFDALTRAVKLSGQTQTRIAELAGVSSEHLSRLLVRPRNVELDTLSRLIFSACGAALKVGLEFPQAGGATTRATDTDTIEFLRHDENVAMRSNTSADQKNRLVLQQ